MTDATVLKVSMEGTLFGYQPRGGLHAGHDYRFEYVHAHIMQARLP